MNRPRKTALPIILEEYMNYLISLEHRTKSTAEEYAGDIVLFFRYIKIQHGLVPEDISYSDIPLDNIDEDFVYKITIDDVFRFLSYLKEKRKYSSSTERRKIAAIRSYFKYAHEVGKYSVIDIDYDLKLPQRVDNIPIFLSEEDSAILINSVDSRNPIRDKMIIALFLHTGIKLMELCNLNVTAIDGEQLQIVNAEHFNRYIPLDDMLLKILGVYMGWRCKKYINIPLKGKDKYALFLSEQKKRISPRAVQDIVIKAAKNAMIKDKTSPQKLRHTFAILLYKKGFNIKEIQKILGHEYIGSTQIYLNIPGLKTNSDQDTI